VKERKGERGRGAESELGNRKSEKHILSRAIASNLAMIGLTRLTEDNRS